MSTFIFVVIAIIVTWLVTTLSTIPVVFIGLFTLGWIIEVAKKVAGKTAGQVAVHLVQLIQYFISDFLALILGAYILLKGNGLRFLPVLFIVVMLISIMYASTKFSFHTKQALKLNIVQKAMSILGAIIAVGATFFITAKW